MIDAVFSHYGFKCTIAKIFSAITNDCARKAKTRKYILFQKIYNFVFIGFTCYYLYLFRYVVNCHKDILVSMRYRKGTHEVDTPNIKTFNN